MLDSRQTGLRPVGVPLLRGAVGIQHASRFQVRVDFPALRAPPQEGEARSDDKIGQRGSSW